MNLVLAIVVFGVVYTIVGIPKEVDKVIVVGVSENSPAELAGLKDGDIILKVGEVEVKKSDELINELEKYKGQEVQVEITDKEQTQRSVRTILVRENPPEGEGSMGVAISNTEMEPIPWYKGR